VNFCLITNTVAQWLNRKSLSAPSLKHRIGSQRASLKIERHLPRRDLYTFEIVSRARRSIRDGFATLHESVWDVCLPKLAGWSDSIEIWVGDSWVLWPKQALRCEAWGDQGSWNLETRSNQREFRVPYQSNHQTDGRRAGIPQNQKRKRQRRWTTVVLERNRKGERYAPTEVRWANERNRGEIQIDGDLAAS